MNTQQRTGINECFPSISVSLTRCYNKTNGTFSSGTLPLMHRVAPCQQDGLEMVPLGQVSSQCRGHDSHTQSVDQEANAGYRSDEHKESSPSQHSCCLISNNETYLADNTGETRFSRKKKFFPCILSYISASSHCTYYAIKFSSYIQASHMIINHLIKFAISRIMRL